MKKHLLITSLTLLTVSAIALTSCGGSDTKKAAKPTSSTTANPIQEVPTDPTVDTPPAEALSGEGINNTKEEPIADEEQIIESETIAQGKEIADQIIDLLRQFGKAYEKGDQQQALTLAEQIAANEDKIDFLVESKNEKTIIYNYLERKITSDSNLPFYAEVYENLTGIDEETEAEPDLEDFYGQD